MDLISIFKNSKLKIDQNCIYVQFSHYFTDVNYHSVTKLSMCRPGPMSVIM